MLTLVEASDEKTAGCEKMNMLFEFDYITDIAEVEPPINGTVN